MGLVKVRDRRYLLRVRRPAAMVATVFRGRSSPTITFRANPNEKAELVAMATDLAEFLGAAVGLQLLFHIPLLWGGIITAFATFVILGLEHRGFRPLEAVIAVMVGVIALCYVAETLLGRPDWGAIGRATVMPRFDGPESVVLASGILGATVMPHVIFLHSALTQGRIVTRHPDLLKRLVRFEIADIVMAMGLAGFVNAAMLIMAASTFHAQGLSGVATIEEAHRTLTPLLGPLSSAFFGVSLLAAGLSSSAVGTMAGQVIMQGFLKHKVPLWIRRGVTMAPSIAVMAMGLDPTQVLIASQVVLSFGVPFALAPLVLFTSNRSLMGVLVNGKATTVAAWAVTAVIVSLNLYIIYKVVTGG